MSTVSLAAAILDRGYTHNDGGISIDASGATRSRSELGDGFTSCVRLAGVLNADGTPSGVNGDYMQTSRGVNGRPVYTKMGKTSTSMWYCDEDGRNQWGVGPTAKVGTQKMWAYSQAHGLGPETAAGPWFVFNYGSNEWASHTSVTVTDLGRRAREIEAMALEERQEKERTKLMVVQETAESPGSRGTELIYSPRFVETAASSVDAESPVRIKSAHSTRSKDSSRSRRVVSLSISEELIALEMVSNEESTRKHEDEATIAADNVTWNSAKETERARVAEEERAAKEAEATAGARAAADAEAARLAEETERKRLAEEAWLGLEKECVSRQDLSEASALVVTDCRVRDGDLFAAEAFGDTVGSAEGFIVDDLMGDASKVDRAALLAGADRGEGNGDAPLGLDALSDNLMSPRDLQDAAAPEQASAPSEKDFAYALSLEAQEIEASIFEAAVATHRRHMLLSASSRYEPGDPF